MLSWIVWGPLLVAQNFAFTFVSRARNSASLKRHAVAAVASNLVWVINQFFLFTTMFKALHGEMGWLACLGAVMYYTVFTMAGSLYAHWWSLRSEKGLARVGAYAKT